MRLKRYTKRLTNYCNNVQKLIKAPYNEKTKSIDVIICIGFAVCRM